MENLKEKYFSLLKKVVKPACYIGNEFNSVKKNWNDDSFKTALVFPDAYVVGESSLSLKILYDLLNKNPDFIAERFFTPAIDFENKLLENKMPLLSMENFRPLKDFDIAGFTIQHEFTYTNILSVLNLSGLKFKAEERDEKDPIICAGGPGAYNPEPIAPIFDFFYLGEVEDTIVEVFELIRKLKKENKSKDEILEAISAYEGIYVPKFYAFSYDNEGVITAVESHKNKTVKKQVIKDFDKICPPVNQLVPYVETIHDRVVVEIFRGCTRGCRFCQAGMIYRPVRERSLDNILKYAKESIKNTGFEEISFVSLNCADYSNIVPLIFKIKNELKNVSISLPSLRVDGFTEELAEALSAGKRSSLTFAPEAGSQRLRDRINKIATEEDILNALITAKKFGWKQAKLYFMIGLPDETYEDLDAIVELVRKILKETGFSLNISVATFVPKPHTPYQWYGQIPMEEAINRIMYLRKRLKHGRIKLSFHNIKQSFIEATLSRADRRIFEVIQKAFNSGCRFDGWSDNFNFDAWISAFAECGLSPEYYAGRKLEYDGITPWDHISCGVSKKFLIEEDMKSKAGAVTYDCRWNKCSQCGVCPEFNVKNILKEKVRAEKFNFERQMDSKNDTARYRIKYSKGDELRFIGHLDFLRLLVKIINRADLPVAYKGQFHPRMRISASHPLSLFYTSCAEYIDIELKEHLKEAELMEIFRKQFPKGIEVLEVKRITSSEKSLMQCFKEVDYEVSLKNNVEKIDKAIKELLKTDKVFLKRKNKEINIENNLKSLKYDRKKDRLFIALKISENGSIKPTDILDMLGVGDNEIEEIKRVEFR